MRHLIPLLTITLTALSGYSIPMRSSWKTPLNSYFSHKRKLWIVPHAIDGAFSPDGKKAALALQDGTTTLFRLRDQKKLAVFDCRLVQGGDFSTPICLAFSPDGSRLAIGFKRCPIVLIVNIEKQKLYNKIKLPFQPQRLRFSPLGRYLLTSDNKKRAGWRMIYSFYRKKRIFFASRPLPCTFSRNDRYFFIAKPVKKEWRISIMESGTSRQIKLKTIPSMGIFRPPLTLRSLRDHRIFIGFQGLFSLGNRFLTGITSSKRTIGHDNGWILPLSGTGMLISGGSGLWKIIRLDNGKSALLNLPAGSHCLDTYPKGYAVLFHLSRDNSIRIKPFTLNQLRWSH